MKHHLHFSMLVALRTELHLHVQSLDRNFLTLNVDGGIIKAFV